MTDAVPKLRPLDFIPFEEGGEPLLVLRDPLELNAEPVVVPQGAGLLLALLDGRRSYVDLQAELVHHTGEIVGRDRIEAFIDALDRACLLETDRFRTRLQEVEEEFSRRGVRPAAHAGRSYEADPERLRRQIEGFFSGPSGPGRPPPSPRGAPRRVRGIIAPHIDLRVGGGTSAHAYRALAEGPPPERFVILGTAHASPEPDLIPTGKDFSTPLGTVPTDRDLLSELRRRWGGDPPPSDLLHRGEHSIEFQLLFLQWLFPAGGWSILPILCGSFARTVASGGSPSDDPRLEGFVGALRESLEASGRRTVFVAGADLAHVGPKFGDPFEARPDVLERVAAADRVSLRRAEEGDAEGFYRSIADERDARKICGLSPIYLLLRLAGGKGRLLRYDQWFEPPTRSAVTYASLVFEDPA